MRLTREEIMGILPHREPFLLIDEVLECEPGRRVAAVKHVRADEPYFRGHFPGHPVMPGVLIVEALAQAGGVAVLSLPENRGKLALFGRIQNARFKRPVKPGETLTLSCEILRLRGPVGVGRAVARVGEQVVCTAELSFAVVSAEAQGDPPL